ncbi:tyrosine-protein kinase hopscotch [Rhopalosiphum maidis]|uniref:tyrosine-protein kinase hopscotch n=1 Tax=Rhopalosiphum maidis TaxID=43146 RepID=UPI000EFDCD8A|nr:tyrosine-protein kinase hopscotch [Rhopalosiphum maidis]XP_026815516.1 tyrosine-protein kinase hopscotch [Rhopalosiphum maidis]
MMDSSISIKVHVAVQSTPHEIPVTINTTVEDVIIETSKLLNIGPVARHLFGLRVLSVTDDNLWLSPSLFILYAKNEHHVYEYKLRYKMPDVKRLKSIDCYAYNFYFYQVKFDLLKSKVTGLCYDTCKRELIGMGVADMYRSMLEEDKSRETVEQNYKHFMPQEVVKQHMFFLKKPVQETLKILINNNTIGTLYVPVIKESYLEQFNSIAPDYLEEEYKALYSENGSSVNVAFRVNPFHSEMPGIRMCTENRKEWVHLAAIEDLCFLSTTDDGTVEISRKTGIPIHLKFLSTSTMFSFITLLNGYYRLMVNWNFDLCVSTNTPSLSKLKSIRCHGPISIMKSTSILKKKMSKKHGSFILRQSMKNYDNYVIDVCINQSMKPMTYVIESKGGFYKLAGDDKIEYPSIWRLITNNKMSLNFIECIFPSDIAMNELLLCQNTSIKHDIGNDDEDDKVTGPHLINSDSIHLLKTICSPKKKMQSLMKVRVATWCKSKRNESTVVVKLFQDDVNINLHLMDLLSLSKRWSSVSSSAIVRLFGLCVDTPTALVSEYFALGPLDTYLRTNKDNILFSNLVEAATYIATALWDMETACLVHGKIRCHKFVVAEHTKNSFIVKLTDPGIHKCYTNYDLYWIPTEFYNTMELARKSPQADIWAFSSTLWELFNYGFILPDVQNVEFFKKKFEKNIRMPKPECCTDDIYHIMTDCWDSDPFIRKKPQATLRDLRQIWLQIYASPQHEYTPLKKEEIYCDDVTCSDATIYCTSDYTIETFLDTVSSSFSSSETKSDFIDFNSNPDDARSYQNENPMIAATNTSFNQFMEQLTSKEEIKNNLQSAMNCQKKTYQFNNATLTLQQVIGQGFYGVVLEGLLKCSDNTTKKVAVKHMKRSFQTEDFQREIGIIEGLSHPNIVEIEGVLEEPNLMLVMEYIELGSLSSYLRLHEDELVEETNRLLKYALDIAQGMEYLGSLNIIHRDLATRNILVSSPTTVKISDFGLAQFLPDEKYYYLQTMRDLPLKWHAPEAILYGKFSPKTDIWAYGVLLFEIFSLGKEPNVVSKLEERLDVEKLIRVLEEGHRLQCPSCPPCTIDIYNKLMRPCWAYVAGDRPNFSDLINNIKSLMSIEPAEYFTRG